MSEGQRGMKTGARFLKRLPAASALALIVVAGIYLLIPAVLNTPYVNSRITGLLTTALHRPVSIAAVRLFGTTLVVKGLEIGNPPGFDDERLCRAGTIEVTPKWLQLIAGRRRFSSIRLSGVEVTLGKNSEGKWNFTGLTDLFKGKKGGGETFVGRLSVTDSTLSVSGRRMDNIAVTLKDLSTSGSTDSRIVLTFRDQFGYPFRIEGSARLGKERKIRLEFAAPSFSFRGLEGLNLPIDTGKGEGRFFLTTTLHGDRVEVKGRGGFDRLTGIVRGEPLPLSATLDFAGSYDMGRDSATIDTMVVAIDRIIRLRARGVAERVRGGGPYSLDVSHDGADIAQIFALLPERVRGDYLLTGKLSPALYRIRGSGREGVSSADIGLTLRQLTVVKGKRLITDGVEGEMGISRVREGWEASGMLRRKGGMEGPLISKLEIPFGLRVKKGIRTIEGDIPSLVATVAGVDVRGEVSYRGGNPEPLSALIEMKDAPLGDFARSLGVKGISIDRGEAGASLRISGGGKGGFRGAFDGALSRVRGRYGERGFALGEMKLSGSACLKGGGTEAEGKLEIGGGDFDGKGGSASASFRMNDDLLVLKEMEVRAEKTRIALGELRLQVPSRSEIRRSGGIPIGFRFSSLRLMREGVGIEGASGDLRALYSSGSPGRRLTGEGGAVVPHLAYREKDVGSLSVRLDLDRGRAKAEVMGKLLDGNLEGWASADPFAPGKGGDFRVDVSGASAVRVVELLPRRFPATPTAGRIDLKGIGVFSRDKGLSCTVNAIGADIALSGEKGRGLFRGGVFDLDARLEGGDLLLRGGRASVGNEPEVTISGRIRKVAASEREGEIVLKVPRVGLSTLFDRFANALPRALQEANVSGSISVDAVVGISGNGARIGGSLTIDRGELDIPSQKLVVSEVSGAVPVDLDFGAKGSSRPPEKISYTRKSYPALLKLLEREAEGEHNLTIGRVRFGTMEFAPAVASIKGGDGVTEIRIFRSGLFNGILLGQGFIGYKGGVNYGADLLVRDLSLQMLCDSYPGIKGYISGRVDGFISLLGSGKGEKGVKGYVELWTREDRDEEMLVSKEFLQKLAGKKLKGVFFRNDRPFDRGEISAYLDGGYLTFKTLDISHTNFFGMKDLSVSVAPVQNMISIDHLLASVREAASRGKKAAGGGGEGEQQPAAAEFKWDE